MQNHITFRTRFNGSILFSFYYILLLEAVLVEQREKVQIFQLEGDLRRECPGYIFSSSAEEALKGQFSKTNKNWIV